MGVDEIGNMFARREGTDPEALPVYVGSHLDTQPRSEEHTSELQSLTNLVCRLLLEKKKTIIKSTSVN